MGANQENNGEAQQGAPHTQASASAPAKTVRDPARYQQALDAWMKRALPDAQGLRVHDVDMPRGTGFSNETAFFSATWQERGAGGALREHSRRYVARIEPEGGGIFPVQTPECEVSVQVQYRIMSQVAALGTGPVPPLLAYEEDPALLGRPFFVMAFIAGEIPADVPRYSQAGFLVEQSTPAEREALVLDGIEKMAALHRIDRQGADFTWLDASGGDDAPRVRDQLRLYRSYCVRELMGREHPVLMQALDWLEERAPELPAHLSWGDARLGNMIFDNTRCAAILDWEAAALLPAQADIGWWVMFDRMSFDDLDIARMPGFPSREQMTKHWEQASGLEAGDMHYWEMLAIMRFCAIMLKLGDRMMQAGIAVEPNVPIENGVTRALRRRLAV